MTNPRVLAPHRVIRWAIPEADWGSIQSEANLPNLTETQRREASRIAEGFLQEAAQHHQGISTGNLKRLDRTTRARLGMSERDGGAATAPLPAQSIGFFINGLRSLFEEVTGKPATIRNDEAVRNDEVEHTDFVRFVFAIWKRLPASNRSAKTLSAMRSRVSKHWRVGGRYPKWDDE